MSLLGRIQQITTREVDCAPRYTPLWQASLHNARLNVKLTYRIGHLFAGQRSPQEHPVLVSRLSTEALQSYPRPRGAPPAVRKEAPLTNPMDLWLIQTTRKTQQARPTAHSAKRTTLMNRIPLVSRRGSLVGGAGEGGLGKRCHMSHRHECRVCQ